MSCHSSYRDQPIQVIEGHYVDQQKLMRLLRNVYGISQEGKNNFRVELRLNRYKIYPSSEHRDFSTLTEDQIQDCRASRKRWNGDLLIESEQKCDSRDGALGSWGFCFEHFSSHNCINWTAIPLVWTIHDGRVCGCMERLSGLQIYRVRLV